MKIAKLVWRIGPIQARILARLYFVSVMRDNKSLEECLAEYPRQYVKAFLRLWKRDFVRCYHFDGTYVIDVTSDGIIALQRYVQRTKETRRLLHHDG